MPKPQPYYARLTQPPRSPNGRNRQAATTNHSDPLDGAGAGAGGANKTTIRTSFPASTWRTINQPVDPINPGVSPNLTATQVRAMQDMQMRMYQQAVYSFLPRLSQRQGTSYLYILPDPPPIPYTGIHSGELTGHRAWLVTDAYELCSLAHYFIWEPRKTIEGDINEVVWTQRVTGDQRFGGVYAYRNFENLRDDELVDVAKKRDQFPRVEYPWARGCPCEDCNVNNPHKVTYLGLAYGTIKLWGETVEHEKGYRASFAKVTGIDGFIGVKGFELEKLRGKYLSHNGE